MKTMLETLSCRFLISSSLFLSRFVLFLWLIYSWLACWVSYVLFPSFFFSACMSPFCSHNLLSIYGFSFFFFQVLFSLLIEQRMQSPSNSYESAIISSDKFVKDCRIRKDIFCVGYSVFHFIFGLMVKTPSPSIIRVFVQNLFIQ